MVYNPGGQLGKSVQSGGQRPAKDPKGSFFGKSATSRKTSASNSKPRSVNPNPGQPRHGRKAREDATPKGVSIPRMIYVDIFSTPRDRALPSLRTALALLSIQQVGPGSPQRLRRSGKRQARL
jgi:hypothetical protein